MRLVPWLALTSLVACSSPAGDPPDAELPVPDAATEPRPRGVLFARGIAGAETLHFRDVTAGTEIALSGSPGQPLCAPKIYCDYPPSPVLSRLFFFDFVSDEHAIYLEMDHFDPTANTIQVAALATGERTLVSDAVDWVSTEPGRPGWIYAFARTGTQHYWSLLTAAGMVLFRGDGAAPLQPIRTWPVPSGEHVIASWVVAETGGIAWSVETATNGPPLAFRHYSWLLSPEGAVRFAWDELPTGARPCDPAILGGATYAVSYYLPADPQRCETWIVDIATLAGRRLDKDEPSFLLSPDLGRSLSADGTRIHEHSYATDRTYVFDTATGARLDEVDGIGTLFSPVDADLLIVRTASSTRVDLRDVATRTSTLLIDGGTATAFWGINRPDQMFTPDGASLISVSGAPFSDLSENIGLHVIGVPAGGGVAIEAPAITEMFFRQPRLSRDGRTLAYLDDVDGQLDIVGIDLATRQVQPLVVSPAPERAFVLGY